MFNKKPSTSAKHAADPAAVEPSQGRRAAPRPPSILGADLIFEGHITGDGEVLVEGVIRGDVEVARLVVGEGATIEGKIRGGLVEVRGRVIGDIEAKAVKLYESCHVEGDITHEQLSIEVGAFFQGRCQQFVPQAEIERNNVIELGTA